MIRKTRVDTDSEDELLYGAVCDGTDSEVRFTPTPVPTPELVPNRVLPIQEMIALLDSGDE